MLDLRPDRSNSGGSSTGMFESLHEEGDSDDRRVVASANPIADGDAEPRNQDLKPHACCVLEPSGEGTCCLAMRAAAE